MIRKCFCTWAVLLGPLAFAASAWAQGPAASDAAVLRVYRSVCLRCHDGDGRGEPIRNVFPKVPDFTANDWQRSRSDAELSHSILEGKGKAMPKMKAKLGTVEVARMVAFVRAFQGGKQVVEEDPGGPAVAAEGREGAMRRAPADPAPLAQAAHLRAVTAQFRRLCTACHGIDGRGTVARRDFPSIPDFTQRAWHEGRTDPHLVVSVLEGKGAAMPPFREKLTREQARDLVALVRTFAPAGARPAEAASPTAFDEQFRLLREEFDTLEKQRRALGSPSPREKAKDDGRAQSRGNGKPSGGR
jgi:mono/diheme cytochrome c family protein